MKVFCFNPDNAYARFGMYLASILNLTVVTPPKRGKKSPANPANVTPIMIGYIYQDDRDPEKHAKVMPFNNSDTFWFFGCTPDQTDKSEWKGATLHTFESPLLFLNALEQELKLPFSPETRRQAEDLATFQIYGAQGLKVLGRSVKAIRKLKQSMEF